MTNPDLQPGKPVQTRSGLEAVVYAVCEGQNHQIHGAYKDERGEWVLISWHADGSIRPGRTNPLDITPKPKKLTGFINVYPCDVHETREAADWRAEQNRIACLDLAALNLTEGHGLTEGFSDE